MVYLLIGPEEFLKNQFIEKLKKSLLKDEPSGVDFELFYAGETKIKNALDSANTSPFISKQKMIVIKNIGKTAAKEKEALLAYVKSSKKSTVLVLETPGFEPTAFTKEVSGHAKAVRFGKLRGRELTSWVMREFSSRKKRISNSTAYFLTELAGDDLFLLKNEVEKIATFLGARNEVSESDIEAVTGEVSPSRVFGLVDAVLAGKTADALELVKRLLAGESKPHRVLSLLAWGIRKESRRFSPERLRQKLDIILEADFSIKQGKSDPREALEFATVSLCK